MYIDRTWLLFHTHFLKREYLEGYMSSLNYSVFKMDVFKMSKCISNLRIQICYISIC